MRPAAPLVPCLVLCLPAFAGEAFAPGPIDLNRPGVLERIERDDPARYAALTDILQVSAQFPCHPKALRLLEVRYDLDDVACGAQLLTRYPAQRVLSFVFQGTSYAARVTVPATERIEPALAPR